MSEHADPVLALDPTWSDDELTRHVLGYYQRTLREDGAAQAFLRDNCIDDVPTLDRLGIGYANRSLGLRLPGMDSKVGRLIRARLQEIGLFRTSGHEHFTGSLVVPFHDASGAVVQVYGRKMLHSQRLGASRDSFLPRPVPPLWNAQALTERAILCESIFDALCFLCAGITHVAALMTTDAADVLTELRDRGVHDVWLAYPRTAGAERATVALAEPLLAGGITCWRLLFPLGMTAREFAKHAPPPAQALDLAIRNARSMGTTITLVQPLPPPSINTPIPAMAEHNHLALLPSAPPAPLPDPGPEARIVGEDVHLVIGDRAYRLRGLGKNTTYDALRVNVRVLSGDACHVDTLDLYNARNRVAFLNAAAEELHVQTETIKRDLGRLILACEQVQEERIRAAMTPTDTAVTMKPQDETEAVAFLRDPALVERILEDFTACGVIGEADNKLLGYVAAVSRKLPEPLAIIVQSSSAAGKTSLMDAILAFVPEEDLVQFSAMTGQSLYYMAETGLTHRVLAIAEEAGVERASYALKILQSEGELRIASTGKDSQTGRLTTQTYTVTGPVALFLTTTSSDLDEELQNRSIVLTVDENREQTRAVHVVQRARKTLAGMLAATDRQAIIGKHRNAQRLLRPLRVVNPYADRLTFPDDRTRTRRDHAKYLRLIEAVALLHQHQREVRTIEYHGAAIAYIDVTVEDIAIANRLAHHALGRSLDDLPPQSRRLLMLIAEYVGNACATRAIDRADFRFTRRDIREATRMGHSQLAVHLGRLEAMEYLIVHGGERGRSRVYELAYDGGGVDGMPVLPGLIDVERLRSGIGDAMSGPFPVPIRGASGGVPLGVNRAESTLPADDATAEPAWRGA